MWICKTAEPLFDVALAAESMYNPNPLVAVGKVDDDCNHQSPLSDDI